MQIMIQMGTDFHILKSYGAKPKKPEICTPICLPYIYPWLGPILFLGKQMRCDIIRLELKPSPLPAKTPYGATGARAKRKK